MKIIRSFTTADGQLVEYRGNPAFDWVAAIHPWFWLPVFVRRWVRAHAVQRRIDGGRWVTIGGYDDSNRIVLLAGAR